MHEAEREMYGAGYWLGDERRRSGGVQVPGGECVSARGVAKWRRGGNGRVDGVAHLVCAEGREEPGGATGGAEGGRAGVGKRRRGGGGGWGCCGRGMAALLGD